MTTSTRSALIRDTALARPQTGFWDAIGNWLASAGRLFMIRRRIQPARHYPARNVAARNSPARNIGTGSPRHAEQPAQPSLRERTEWIQLQAENRRLRQQLERMAARTQAAAPPQTSPAVEGQTSTPPVSTLNAAQTSANALILLTEKTEC